jgi:hypothetical protein
MSPLRDTSLCLRATSDGTLTTAGAMTDAVEWEGTPLKGMALKVTLSTGSGTGAGVTVTLHSSTTTTVPTSDSKVIATLSGATAVASAGGTGTFVSYIMPFCDPQSRSIKAKLDWYGTSPVVIDTVEVYVVPNVGTEWSREVNFH